MKTPTVDRLFRAFADQTRLRILALLSKGEICVCDLMSVLKNPQSKVSRHLGYLRKAGLVVSRRDEQWVYYALAKPAGQFHARLLSCIDGCFDEVPSLGRDQKALTALRKSEAKCC